MRETLQAKAEQVKACGTFEESVPVLWKLYSTIDRELELKKAVILHLEKLNYAEMKKKSKRLVVEIKKAIKESQSLTKVLNNISKQEQIAPWNVQKSISVLSNSKNISEEVRQSLGELKAQLAAMEQPRYSFFDQDRYWSYRLAEATVSLFLKVQPMNATPFCKKYGISLQTFHSLTSVVENQDEELYAAFKASEKQRMTAKLNRGANSHRKTHDQQINDKIEKLKGLTDQETFEIMTTDPTYFYPYCKLHNLNEAELRFYMDGKGNNLQTFLTLNDEQKKEALDSYLQKLKQEVSMVAEGMSQKMMEEKRKPKSEIVPFDIYSFTKNSCIPLGRLEPITTLVGTREEREIIHDFKEKHLGLFCKAKERQLLVYRQSDCMICEGYMIDYTKKEFELALQDMKDHHLPNCYGVLFGAIMNQKRLSQEKAGKEKVKSI
ncbi:MAG TPA: hypothetical protein IAC24_02940 [Candidatus Onthousia faecigallinarum]|nr:hypothetical protein [Candidatus Onthousia faecigallinarum]